MNNSNLIQPLQFLTLLHNASDSDKSILCEKFKSTQVVEVKKESAIDSGSETLEEKLLCTNEEIEGQPNLKPDTSEPIEGVKSPSINHENLLGKSVYSFSIPLGNNDCIQGHSICYLNHDWHIRLISNKWKFTQFPVRLCRDEEGGGFSSCGVRQSWLWRDGIYSIECEIVFADSEANGPRQQEEWIQFKCFLYDHSVKNVDRKVAGVEMRKSKYTGFTYKYYFRNENLQDEHQQPRSIQASAAFNRSAVLFSGCKQEIDKLSDYLCYVWQTITDINLSTLFGVEWFGWQQVCITQDRVLYIVKELYDEFKHTRLESFGSYLGADCTLSLVKIYAGDRLVYRTVSRPLHFQSEIMQETSKLVTRKQLWDQTSGQLIFDGETRILLCSKPNCCLFDSYVFFHYRMNMQTSQIIYKRPNDHIVSLVLPLPCLLDYCPNAFINHNLAWYAGESGFGVQQGCLQLYFSPKANKNNSKLICLYEIGPIVNGEHTTQDDGKEDCEVHGSVSIEQFLDKSLHDPSTLCSFIKPALFANSFVGEFLKHYQSAGRQGSNLHAFYIPQHSVLEVVPIGVTTDEIEFFVPLNSRKVKMHLEMSECKLPNLPAPLIPSHWNVKINANQIGSKELFFNHEQTVSQYKYKYNFITNTLTESAVLCEEELHTDIVETLPVYKSQSVRWCETTTIKRRNVQKIRYDPNSKEELCWKMSVLETSATTLSSVDVNMYTVIENDDNDCTTCHRQATKEEIKEMKTQGDDVRTLVIDTTKKKILRTYQTVKEIEEHHQKGSTKIENKYELLSKEIGPDFDSLTHNWSDSTWCEIVTNRPGIAFSGNLSSELEVKLLHTMGKVRETNELRLLCHTTHLPKPPTCTLSDLLSARNDVEYEDHFEYRLEWRDPSTGEIAVGQVHLSFEKPVTVGRSGKVNVTTFSPPPTPPAKPAPAIFRQTYHIVKGGESSSATQGASSSIHQQDASGQNSIDGTTDENNKLTVATLTLERHQQKELGTTYKAAITEKGKPCIVKLKLFPETQVVIGERGDKLGVSLAYVEWIRQVTLQHTSVDDPEEITGLLYVDEYDEKQECPMCRDTWANEIAYPCKHKACSDCWSRHRQTSQTCCICRQVVDRFFPLKMLQTDETYSLTHAYSFVNPTSPLAPFRYERHVIVKDEDFDPDIRKRCSRRIYCHFTVQECAKWFEYLETVLEVQSYLDRISKQFAQKGKLNDEEAKSDEKANAYQSVASIAALALMSGELDNVNNTPDASSIDPWEL